MSRHELEEKLDKLNTRIKNHKRLASRSQVIELRLHHCQMLALHEAERTQIECTLAILDALDDRPAQKFPVMHVSRDQMELLLRGGLVNIPAGYQFRQGEDVSALSPSRSLRCVVRGDFLQRKTVTA